MHDPILKMLIGHVDSQGNFDVDILNTKFGVGFDSLLSELTENGVVVTPGELVTKFQGKLLPKNLSSLSL